MNREPVAAHLELMRRKGFEIVEVIRRCDCQGLGRDRHAPRWQRFSDEDLATRTAFVIARRKG